LLDQYFDLDEHLPTLIESQLKRVAGLDSESALDIFNNPA
jgi:hypothetical protein